jgi:hypothetical protein
MITSPSPLRFPAESTHRVVKQNASKAADFESMARARAQLGRPSRTHLLLATCRNGAEPSLHLHEAIAARSSAAWIFGTPVRSPMHRTGTKLQFLRNGAPSEPAITKDRNRSIPGS